MRLTFDHVAVTDLPTNIFGYAANPLTVVLSINAEEMSTQVTIIQQQLVVIQR